MSSARCTLRTPCVSGPVSAGRVSVGCTVPHFLAPDAAPTRFTGSPILPPGYPVHRAVTFPTRPIARKQRSPVRYT
ncbi:hypothetical protein Adi01nite_24160 [Amorphoplanes digitatis]|nr:hypothetical protein Adi01nite_24160 [Actinoplanes digitatis]